MSRRSRAAYFSSIERVYSHCQTCGTTGARWAKDGKCLCKNCRAAAKKELPKGFTCSCGKFERFPPYVYAHWRDELAFTCECGKKYTLCEGVVEQ